ncbi:cytochrome c oxidase subunit II [Kocuria palustris]|uniref:aa3-type cytochrome oxidase subunit II n=1 Tax=Kocuria palustris TaxID=71999 RepID=UPI0028D11AD4|nr:cytochrome c oxidase subunit II [Kocuria palustris]
MSSLSRTVSRRRRTLTLSALGGAALLALTGCSAELNQQVRNGFMPVGDSAPTDNAQAILDLWVGSWIAAMLVGLVTWGLMLWCMIAYRRRKNEVGYPRQVAYHLPLEIFYTFVPIALVVTLFVFSERTLADITPRHDNPDTTVQVIGKQWAWDFNYTDDDVYYSGTQAHLNTDGSEGVEETLPTLYLPADSDVELEVTSRDVIHSFWVPAFLEKMDMIPNQTNYLSFTTGDEGTFQGKCAELCGEYHSEMLFNVEIVSQEEYDQQMQALRDQGNTGQLGTEYDRNPNTNDEAIENQDSMPGSTYDEN